MGKPVGTSGYEVIEVVFGVQSGVKNYPNRPGFSRVFLRLKGWCGANRKDIFRRLRNVSFTLNVGVDYNGKVRWPTHESVLLQHLKDVGSDPLLEHSAG